MTKRFYNTMSISRKYPEFKPKEMELCLSDDIDGELVEITSLRQGDTIQMLDGDLKISAWLGWGVQINTKDKTLTFLNSDNIFVII